jgi:hypothetical protein
MVDNKTSRGSSECECAYDGRFSASVSVLEYEWHLDSGTGGERNLISSDLIDAVDDFLLEKASSHVSDDLKVEVQDTS